MNAARPSSRFILVGRRLGNYQLVKFLGKGGFASIYLGYHIHLHTYAAIKVPTRHLTREDMKSFIHEARIAAHLRHPSIIRVLECGVEENVPFLAMDYAPYGSIRQRHPYGEKIRLSVVVNYVKQISQALQYIHDQGFIHQDVKPENMLLSYHNRVLLSDFGITIIAHRIDSYNDRPSVGTISYMAPEQILGNPCFASDLYALGVVIYEWLCGSPPFQGTPNEIMQQHLHDAPIPLREKIPGFPSAIDRVLQRSLAKAPEQRYVSVQEFAQALEEAYKAANLASHPQILNPGTRSVPLRQKNVAAPVRRKKSPNIWKDAATLFATDMLVGTVVFITLFLLGIQVQTLWFFLLLCLVSFPLLGSIFLKRRNTFLYVISMFALAALLGIGFHSLLLFALVYIGSVLLSTFVAFSLSLHTR